MLHDTSPIPLPNTSEMDLLRIGVSSVGGSPDMTVIKNTVMFSIVDIPGGLKLNLKLYKQHLRVN